MAVTAVGKEMGRDVRYVSPASRMAAEPGSHLIKTQLLPEVRKLVNGLVYSNSPQVPLVQTDWETLSPRVFPFSPAGQLLNNNFNMNKDIADFLT